MRSDDTSRDMMPYEPSGQRDTGLRLGTILAWDLLTGANTVDIEGQEISDLKAVQGGIGIRYTAGDVVVIQRKQTTFYILGKVAAPGGAAGSAPVGSAGNHVSTGISTPVYPAFGDLPIVAPVSITTYIGSSRTALILWKCMIACNQSAGFVSFQVTGASDIPANQWTGMRIMNSIENGSQTSEITASGFYVMGPGAGLKAGLNTFTLKYSVRLYPPGTGADFRNSEIAVIPL